MSEELAAVRARLGERYAIERELGRGGMGAVYLARDRRLDRPVALKVLPEAYAAVPELRERFLRETRTAAGFSHPNIVPVFAVEESDDLLAFAMGFVEGESVAARVARSGPLSTRDTVRLLQDVGYALAYAHGRGVVHRDIKPDNIMIERATGRALVMDFGIARAITPVADKPGLTRVGEVVGTPEYMSPEQASGDAVDGRADLYSLGLVAWYAATGTTAMTGESTQRILVRQLTEPVPPLAPLRPDLPAALCDVIDQCCAKEADDRYANAEALVDALDAAQLAGPEIPVAVRLITPELSGASTRGIAAVVLVALGSAMIASNGNGNVLAIGLLIGASAWVGGLSALRECRELIAGGYTAEEIQRLMALILAERDDRRASRKRDPRTLRRRRIQVGVATALLVWQGATIVRLRIEQGNSNIKLHGTASTLWFFAALLSTALALAILLISPFRRPLGDRLLALVWLGRIGRRIMTLGTGRRGTPAPRVQRTAPRVTAPSAVAQRVTPIPPTVTPAPVSIEAPTLATLAADVQMLHARVTALEQQRP